MAAQASRARELPGVNDNVSFELGHVTSAQDTLETDELYGSGSPRIIGDSAALRRVLGTVRIVAPTDSTVLVNGETELARNSSQRPFTSAAIDRAVHL